MKKNNEDFVIDKDSLAGPAIQKTDLYKNMEKEICIHALAKDTYPHLRVTKKFKDRGIKFNFYRSKKRGIDNNYYVAKYLFLWEEMLANTCLPIADSLNLNPLEFITEQLEQYCEIIKESFAPKEIKKVEEVKESILQKANAKTKMKIKSIVAE